MPVNQQDFLHQKGYKSLVLWTFWAAAAIAVYLSFYQGTDVWNFVENDPSRITWITLVLFVLGVFTSFVVTVRLTLEHVKVVEMERRARTHGLTGIKAKPNSGRIVERFFAALTTIIATSNNRPAVTSLIDIELASLRRIAGMVELGGTILITLGLIGTVLGLSMTLTGLTASMDALGKDYEELMRGLRDAMGGMGTAFYATLLGAVLGGVLLRVFAQLNENAVDGLHDAMMRVCLVYCAADLQPSLERDLRFLDAQVLNLGKNVDALRAVFDQSRLAMEQFENQLRAMHTMAWRDSDRDALAERLRAHHDYANLLRHEIEMNTRLYGSWWDRLKSLLRRVLG